MSTAVIMGFEELGLSKKSTWDLLGAYRQRVWKGNKSEIIFLEYICILLTCNRPSLTLTAYKT